MFKDKNYIPHFVRLSNEIAYFDEIYGSSIKSHTFDRLNSEYLITVELNIDDGYKTFDETFDLLYSITDDEIKFNRSIIGVGDLAHK